MDQIHKKQHYVPQMYLRNWSDDGNTVWLYRKLVSHESVKSWTRVPIKSIAYGEHFYSLKESEGFLSDEYEKWLDNEIEAPMKDVLTKIDSEGRLSAQDYLVINRFILAQMTRTPGFFARNRETWLEMAKGAIENVFSNDKKSCHRNKSMQISIPRKLVPIKLNRTLLIDNPNAEIGLKVDVTIGRKMQLLHMTRMAQHKADVLSDCKWFVIKSAPDKPWLTSDDPVICLNYRNDDDYDFNVGLKQKNANILFPLSPQHLLFTQVGSRRPVDVLNCNDWFNILVNRMTIEHAQLQIYAASPIKDICEYSTRIVNETLYKEVNNSIRNWHDDNTKKES